MLTELLKGRGKGRPALLEKGAVCAGKKRRAGGGGKNCEEGGFHGN